MAVYAITGKLGSGKGKAAIDQIRRYLRAGIRMARIAYSRPGICRHVSAFLPGL